VIEEFFDSDEFKTGKPGVNRYIVYKIVLSSGQRLFIDTPAALSAVCLSWLEIEYLPEITKNLL
jgi:hypothetical protein